MKNNSASQAGFLRRSVSTGLVAAVTALCLTMPVSKADQAHQRKSRSQPATENFWASTGGPQGGDVLAMVTANSYLFAGTLGGGAFRSADNGETWTTVNNGLTATMFARSPPTRAERFLPARLAVSFARATTAITGRRLTTGWIIRSSSLSRSIPTEISSPGRSKAAAFIARSMMAQAGP
jgi:hypothetical protein